MADVINLRLVRKRRNRDKKAEDSAVKRVKFGLSKQDKSVIDFERTREEQHLDAHKRENDPEEDS